MVHISRPFLIFGSLLLAAILVTAMGEVSPMAQVNQSNSTQPPKESEPTISPPKVSAPVKPSVQIQSLQNERVTTPWKPGDPVVIMHDLKRSPSDPK
jgi:hypothetical protein